MHGFLKSPPLVDTRIYKYNNTSKTRATTDDNIPKPTNTCLKAHYPASCEPSHMTYINHTSILDVDQVYQVSLQTTRICRRIVGYSWQIHSLTLHLLAVGHWVNLLLFSGMSLTVIWLSDCNTTNGNAHSKSTLTYVPDKQCSFRIYSRQASSCFERMYKKLKAQSCFPFQLIFNSH